MANELIEAIKAVLPSKAQMNFSARNFADDELISATATREQWLKIFVLITQASEQNNAAENYPELLAKVE